MAKEEKVSFEEAVQRLEQIVRQLETGNAPLDRSLELYEEGISLVKKCTSELKNAEKALLPAPVKLIMSIANKIANH